MHDALLIFALQRDYPRRVVHQPYCQFLELQHSSFPNKKQHSKPKQNKQKTNRQGKKVINIIYHIMSYRSNFRFSLLSVVHNVWGMYSIFDSARRQTGMLLPHTHSRTHSNAQMLAHVDVLACTSSCTYIGTCMHKSLQKCSHTLKRAHIRLQTHKRT